MLRPWPYTYRNAFPHKQLNEDILKQSMARESFTRALTHLRPISSYVHNISTEKMQRRHQLLFCSCSFHATRYTHKYMEVIREGTHKGKKTERENHQRNYCLREEHA